MRHFGEKHKKTIIFELEFLALVVALVHWKAKLTNRPCVAYLDNNSTRDVAISGRGRNPTAKALASVLLALEDAGEIRCWCARVPSPSNVADLPSRELCSEMLCWGKLALRMMPVMRLAAVFSCLSLKVS